MVSITGGRKLENELARLATNLTRAGTLRVGFLENATYPDGKQVAMIAAIQEFGSGTIPSRPYFRNMIRAKSPGWPAALAINLRDNDYDAQAALPLMGEVISGQLRQSIVDTNAPPLAASTIARKGHSKPLVDTGVMLGSVDYDVR